MTCLKWLRLLNEPLKKIMRCFNYSEALFWFSPLMLSLGWLGACSHMLDSYKVTISLYDHLVFDFWCHLMLLLLSLCMIMAVVALLVGRSQSFASPHFVLSMSSTRASNSWKPSCSKSVHHTYLLAICYSKVHLTCFYLPFKLNSFWCYAKIGQ
jgi:hypothetical protein